MKYRFLGYTDAAVETTIKTCKMLKIKYRILNDFDVISMCKNDKKIDFYPKKWQCFWHEAQEWGQVTDIKSFLTFEYLPKQTT